MPPTRAQQNAKLIQRTQRRSTVTSAKESANKFTKQQSRFELRQEETQLQKMAQLSTNNDTNFSTAGKGEDDFLFSSEAPTNIRGTTGAPGRAKRPGDALPTSTRSGVFGLSAAMPPSRNLSRSARRAERFQLEGKSDVGGAGIGLGQGLLGALRRPRQEEESDLLGDDNGDQPPEKMTKQERFKEVIHNSRAQRAANQRQRNEREEQTIELDKEFNALRHLLPTRDKEEEERQAFLRCNTPEVRALLQEHRQRNPTGKVLTIKSSGEFSIASNTGPATAASGVKADSKKDKKITFLDQTDKSLLTQVRDGIAASAEELELDADDEDDFDKMMHTMSIDTRRRAHASERLLSEEELLLQEAQQAVLEADRSELPQLGLLEKDMIQRGRGEWIQRGGDDVFRMDEEDEQNVYDDNVDIPSSYEGESDRDDNEDIKSVPSMHSDERSEGSDDMDYEEEGDQDPTSLEKEKDLSTLSGSSVLDGLLSKLEKIAKTEIDDSDLVSKKKRAADVHLIIAQLFVHAKANILHVSNTFRAVLIESEKQFLRGNRKSLSRPLMLYLYVMSKIFPTSDYRHEVMTPFYIFLCSTLMQMRLDSVENVHCYMVLASLAGECLRSGQGRFAAEVVVAAFNVLSLQLPRSSLEPARYQGLRVPFPLMERTDEALLKTSASNSKSTTKNRVEILSLSDAETLLLSAYRLLSEMADTYNGMAAFPAVFLEPFQALDKLLNESSSWKPSSAVKEAHEALGKQLQETVKAVQNFRTPLAMRTFRPRPLRQFDPLLSERPESSVRNEIKILKRTMREDKKRVIRHLTAEATVERRAREKEAAADDEIREKRYRQVMGQLQSQQHLMNTVDSMMEKARSNKRGGVNKKNTKGGEGGGGAE